MWACQKKGCVLRMLENRGALPEDLITAERRWSTKKVSSELLGERTAYSCHGLISPEQLRRDLCLWSSGRGNGAGLCRLLHVSSSAPLDLLPEFLRGCEALPWPAGFAGVSISGLQQPLVLSAKGVISSCLSHWKRHVRADCVLSV